jgi:hypothetical protein
MKFENLSGKKFNRLLVLEIISCRNSKDNRTKYKCLCDCGNTKIIDGSLIKTGRTKSCGCLQKEIASKIFRKEEGINGFNSAKREYKRHAKQRNLDFALSDDILKKLFTSDCYYCGSKPINLIKDPRATTEFSKNNLFYYNGIDRVDSTKGYIVDNVVPCCKICNWMKREFTKKEFINHIKNIMLKQFPNISIALSGMYPDIFIKEVISK